MTAFPDPVPQADRRAVNRTGILGDLRGEVMVFQPMSVREIGHAGALIESSFPLQIESLHELRLQLGDDVVVVKGRVVHCSVVDVDREFVAYQSGVEFVEPGEGTREIIARFVDAIHAARTAR